MKNCPVDKIRNFVLAGHAGAGKTTLADLLLFKSGAVGRKGSVDNGTSVSDFRAEEQERKNSIYTGKLCSNNSTYDKNRRCCKCSIRI